MKNPHRWDFDGKTSADVKRLPGFSDSGVGSPPPDNPMPSFSRLLSRFLRIAATKILEPDGVLPFLGNSANIQQVARPQPQEGKALPQEHKRESLTEKKMNTALLKEQELEHCQRIATRRTTHGKRAIALLAVHEGQTQTQAAAKSGLTVGGVRYWIGKFRAQRLGIFSPVSGSAPASTAAPKPSPKAKTGETKDKEPKPKEKKKSKKKKRSKGGKKKSEKKDKKGRGRKKDKKGGKKGKKQQRGKGKRSKKGKKSKK